MLKKILTILLFFSLFSSNLFAEKVGLVLSGGGAKGAVHIGMIKALEENDIPIDYISGTSIGAIVGSLYAMGYSPDEMLELFLSEEFSYWQTGKVEEKHQFFFRERRKEADFIKFNVPLRDSLRTAKNAMDITSSILPNSLVNPIQMNQAFLQLFSQATAQCQGNFNNLFVPFLCVASDTYNKKAVIFRTGDLGDAVRSSMSFPFVFPPVVKDEIPLYDGGIFDNFPVRPMKNAWNPDFIIGSTLAGNSSKKPSELTLYDQVSNMVMQQTEYRIRPEDGVLFRFSLEDVGLLDFYKSKELFDLGYERTIEMIDSIKSRISERVPYEEIVQRREAYKNSLPDLIFKNIYITGTNDSQRKYIESQIRKEETGRFTFEEFKTTYFSLLTNPKIKEIVPHALYDPESKTFDLFLDIQTQDEIGVAFGGNISSMNANQIYLGLSYNILRELSSSYHLDMQLGNAYTGVGLEGKIEIPSYIPFDISLLFAHNYRKYYESKKLFIDTEISTFMNQQETYGKLSLGLPFQNKAKTDVFVGYGELVDNYYQEAYASYYGVDFDKSTYKLFIAGLYYNKNSLDFKQYPTKGHNHQLLAQYVSGKEKFKPADRRLSSASSSQSYIQLNASLNNYHQLSSKFHLGYLIEGVFSTKNLWSNFTSSVMQAPTFNPTPHSMMVFNEAFRANQYFAAQITPIWKLNNTIHVRGDFAGFVPIYPILRGENNTAYYGDMLSRQDYMGELSVVLQLPFMNVSLFGNYYSYPKNNWNFGLNIGYLIFGPKFIR